MILVTGATGFVGRAVVEELLERGYQVRAAVRSEGRTVPPRADVMRVGDLDAATDWRAALHGAGVVIHAAARVHVMQDAAQDPLREFRRVNVDGTLALAKQAAALGVRRFIFVSSVKVNGEGTEAGRPFFADDQPAPSDPYGISKAEAEEKLRELAASTGMEVVIIRPPLVYGPGVRANFQAMMRWLDRGVPLPLGAINNRRSLVALGNLVDLICVCVEHTAAAQQTFLVSDNEDLSTSQLLRRMGQALGRPARLVPVPVVALRAMAALLGRSDMAQRLCGSLQLDVTKTRKLLGWNPPVSVDEGLKKAALGYRSEKTV